MGSFLQRVRGFLRRVTFVCSTTSDFRKTLKSINDFSYWSRDDYIFSTVDGGSTTLEPSTHPAVPLNLMKKDLR